MEIDGKNLNKLNQRTNVGKSSSAKNTETSTRLDTQSSARLSSASQFALNQSGLDQKLRRTNDSITQIQSRKETLNGVENALEKLNSEPNEVQFQETKILLADVVSDKELFVNNKTYQTLKQLLSSDVSDKSFSADKLGPAIGEIKDEQLALQNEFSHQIKQLEAKNDTTDIRNIVGNFKSSLDSNPSILAQAHGQIVGETAHGLLGEH